MKLKYLIFFILLAIKSPTFAVVSVPKSGTIMQQTTIQNSQKKSLSKIAKILKKIKRYRDSDTREKFFKFFQILAVAAFLLALFSLVIYFLPAATTPILTFPFKAGLLDAAFWAGIGLLSFFIAKIINE